MTQSTAIRKYYRLGVGGMWAGSVLMIGGIIALIAKASAVEWTLFILGLLCGAVSLTSAVKFRRRKDAAAEVGRRDPGARW